MCFLQSQSTSLLHHEESLLPSPSISITDSVPEDSFSQYGGRLARARSGYRGLGFPRLGQMVGNGAGGESCVGGDIKGRQTWQGCSSRADSESYEEWAKVQDQLPRIGGMR